jgi:hypothetical protein
LTLLAVHDEFQRQLGVQYQTVYPLIQEAMAESNKSWMVDMSDAFDGSEPLYIDWCHVVAEGNEIIAAVGDAITPTPPS